MLNANSRYSFLMLPATFEKDDQQLRVSRAVITILAIALLAAGFSCTALLCFAVRKSSFQIESIFVPALISCVIGLLTVLYNFLVFTRYKWDTGALLTTVAAAVGSIVYACLIVWKQRKHGLSNRRKSTTTPQNESSYRGQHTSISLVPLNHKSSETTLDPNFYNNYNRNMFPAAQNTPSPQISNNGGFDPHSVTEEEMQRQQMLMLLLQNQQPSIGGASPNPSAQGGGSSSTYNIDWQGRDDEDPGPAGGYFPPPPLTAYPGSATTEMRPWDGVFRAPPRNAGSGRERERQRSWEERDARRAEIERG